MARFTLTELIAAPLPRVFDLATDVAAAPGRFAAITKVEMLTPGPVGAGTRFRETRLMFGKEATEEMEFGAFETNQRYEIVATSCGAEFRTEFRFAPEGAGTRVDVTMTSRPLTFLARLMSPLAGLMTGVMKKCVASDLADLKRAAESPAG